MKTFFTSDQHWHHANILKFTGKDGNLIRPNFSDLDEMNAYMIDQWNSVVKKNDKVYHLGDVIMKTGAWAFEDIIPKLNGNITLIRGNHDKAKASLYLRFFKDIRSEIHLKTKEGDMVIFTHRPIFLSDNEFKNREYHVFNVHGHIHEKTLEDSRYINVSVEQTEYKPVSWEQIQEDIKQIKAEKKDELE